jgi:hypothetical protein
MGDVRQSLWIPFGLASSGTSECLGDTSICLGHSQLASLTRYDRLSSLDKVLRVSPAVLGLAGVILEALFPLQVKMRTVGIIKQIYGSLVRDDRASSTNW